jgi:hypothetical protein
LKAVITMHKLLSIVACAGLVAATLPARALSLVSTTANGNRVAASVAASPLPTIAADIGFADWNAVSLVFELSANDADGLAAFNAVIANSTTGRGLTALELTLDRGSFAQVGNVTPAFGAIAALVGDGQRQRISFEPAAHFGVDLGNPFAAPGQADWLLGLSGLQPGERFTLTVSAVPEPGGLALALLGIGVLATRRFARA